MDGNSKARETGGIKANHRTRHTPIEEIPEEWTSCTLQDLVDVKHGYAFKSEFFSSFGQFVVLTPGNFFENGGFRSRGKLDRYYTAEFPPEYLLKAGDLIVAMTEQAEGLLGSPAIVPALGKYLHNQRLGLASIFDRQRLGRDYLFRVLNTSSVRRHISVTAGGTKVKHTSPAKILSTWILLPPPPRATQDCRDSLQFGSGHRANREADRGQGTSQEGPHATVAHRELRFPEFRKLTDGTRKTRFGPVSSDWPYLPVSKFAHEVKERHDGEDEIPVLSCTKYAGLVDSLSYFGKRVFSEDTSGYKVVRGGQFAYATNHIEEGAIGLLEDTDAGLVSPMYTVFEVDSKRVHSPFLFRLLKPELYRHIFEINTNASVNWRGSLRWSQFRNIRVALPPMEEQLAISACLDAADREISLLRRNLTALQQQKKGLMQKLLTGKVRVSL